MSQRRPLIEVHASIHHHSEAEERRIREAALDQTIEASFPASDPPSTNPNPCAHDAVEHVVSDTEDAAPER